MIITRLINFMLEQTAKLHNIQASKFEFVRNIKKTYSGAGMRESKTAEFNLFKDEHGNLYLETDGAIIRTDQDAIDALDSVGDNIEIV